MSGGAEGGADGGGGRSKERALAACAEAHGALIACFKTCTLASSFVGCCTEAHAAFWGCYREARGTSATRVATWLDEKTGVAPKVADE
jgi:hypothetical protein